MTRDEFKNRWHKIHTQSAFGGHAIEVDHFDTNQLNNFERNESLNKFDKFKASCALILKAFAELFTRQENLSPLSIKPQPRKKVKASTFLPELSKPDSSERTLQGIVKDVPVLNRPWCG